MIRSTLHRLFGMAVVMAIVISLVFLIVHITPGDPAAVMLGPDATGADIAALRDQMGLNAPLWQQFFHYIIGVLHGDLGRSIFLNIPVTEALWQRAEPTFFLTLMALLVATLIALPVGILSAYYRGSWFDQIATSVAMLSASIPSFWLGLLFIQFFAVKLGWFDTSGYGGPTATFGERMNHLLLPALSLGAVCSALIMRFTRASMLDVLNDDYVRTARAKGMSEYRVVVKHAFKNALIPVVTVIGLTAALLISGAIVTETVFGIPGVGSLTVSAVLRRDYPVIQGTLLVISGLYVLMNFAVDMLYLWIDPRVRY
ncbi:ABC transporter permease [Scandinavium manionii]|uniref:ABC transporter permease n=1 Tax=Scandinavium manionii TaxID=2926520 RepID=UPI0013587BB1|nr:ABC transporter permease [Scandinavium manionii]MCS2147921.1 ABC transporter permease [Scandinavium manionii]MCS2166369.1 ABC transporter permease [Scandinavium manionii]